MGRDQKPDAYLLAASLVTQNAAAGAAMRANTNPGDMDKVSEEKMAELLGTTKRALQARRARKQIPEGVWIKIGRKIIYSKRRYDEWLESQWVCPPGWKSTETHCASGLPGTDAGAAKRSRIPSRRKGLQLHPFLEIK
ncbi:hypothetical protein D3C84_687940 [compost metagenome]